jgi:hypothetical protein
MDSSFRVRQASATLETSKSFFASLRFLASLITWLAGFIELTEEEREGAGIYLGPLWDE